MNRDFSCKESTSSRAIPKRFRLGRFLRTVFIICSVMGFTGLAQVGHAQDLDGPAFFGNSPPAAGSSASLFFEEDIVNEQVFSWTSSDSILGDIDTGIVQGVNIQRWLTFGAEPKRLVFMGSGDGATFYGNVLFEPYNRAVVDVVKGSKWIRYLLTVIQVDFITGTGEVIDPDEFIPVLHAETLEAAASTPHGEEPPGLPSAGQFPFAEAESVTLTMTFTTPLSETVQDAIDVAISNPNGSKATTLTETDLDSKIFEHASGTKIKIISSPEFETTEVDFLTVEIDDTTLDINNIQLPTIETGLNTLVFKSERVQAQFTFSSALSPTVIDVVTVQVSVDGFESFVQGFLTETGQNTGIFENNDGSIRATLVEVPSFSPTESDRLIAIVSATSLNVEDEPVTTTETDVNTLLFTTYSYIDFDEEGSESQDSGEPVTPLPIPERLQFHLRIIDPTITEDTFEQDIVFTKNGVESTITVTMVQQGTSDVFLTQKPMINFEEAINEQVLPELESSFTLIDADEITTEHKEVKVGRGTIKLFVVHRAKPAGRAFGQLTSESQPASFVHSTVVELYAVLRIREKEQVNYCLGFVGDTFPNSASINDNGTPKQVNLKRWNKNALGNLEFSWKKVVPKYKAYTNTLRARPQTWAKLDYTEQELSTQAWKLPSQFVGGLQNLGTTWYSVDVRYTPKRGTPVTISAPGSDTRNNTNRDQAISDKVMRIAVRGNTNNDFLNHALSFINVPWLYASSFTKQAKKRIGGDCADIAMAAYIEFGGKAGAKDASSTGLVENARKRRKQQFRAITSINNPVDVFSIPANKLQPGDIIVLGTGQPGQWHHTTIFLRKVGTGNTLEPTDECLMATWDRGTDANKKFRISTQPYSSVAPDVRSGRGDIHKKGVVIRLSK